MTQFYFLQLKYSKVFGYMSGKSGECFILVHDLIRKQKQVLKVVK
jgi:hypothetical protein